GGVRRARRLPGGVADLRGGVLSGRRARPGGAERDLPAGARAAGARHARAAAAFPAADGLRGGGVGAGLVGARGRERPGGGAVPRGAHRWGLAAVGAEDLELPGDLRALAVRA